MVIVSVNVSSVQVFDDDGKTVRTGIFKLPVDGRVRVATLNLDGDDQADRRNHGGEHKAVYAFGQQHLAHWREALAEALAEPSTEHPDGRSAENAIAPGFFGENLSIDTFDETTIRVGDRFRAGTALLEITQPRVPCFKQGLRAGVRSLPRMFVRHGRTGAYLRVIEEGQIAAADALALEVRGTMPHTLAELFAAVHDLGGPGRREVLDAALAAEALSDEWRDVVESKLRRLNG